MLRIIAEGVPESQTRAFNKVAQEKGVGIIGPATVGGIKVGPKEQRRIAVRK
jgi:ATP citrate (pro-S)-lyase